jgi:hypothetical protein
MIILAPESHVKVQRDKMVALAAWVVGEVTDELVREGVSLA